MADQTPDPTPTPDTAPAPTPANPGSLLSTSPPTDTGPAPQPQQPAPERQGVTDKGASDTAQASAEARARVDAWQAAVTSEGRKAAYEALDPEEKRAAYEKLSEADRKALGIVDPSRPTYTEFKLPEGATVDEASMKAASDLFADSGLTQEQAQKFIDLATAREQAAAKAGVQAFVELQNKWVSEVKADPDIGGDKLDATLASAARAIDRLAVPGLREALDLTGGGNHPAVVKAFARVGQMISEDRFQPGNGAPPAASRSPAEVIYGGQPKQSGDA
jgi:hypothetical protein